MQQTIQPGDQMWVNIAELVRNRVPDRKGNTLPADLSSVTYDLRDLTPGGHGLMVNALAANTSYGPQDIPLYGICCGYSNLAFDPSEVTIPIGGNDSASVMGEDECNQEEDDISPSSRSRCSQRSLASIQTR